MGVVIDEEVSPGPVVGMCSRVWGELDGSRRPSEHTAALTRGRHGSTRATRCNDGLALVASGVNRVSATGSPGRQCQSDRADCAGGGGSNDSDSAGTSIYLQGDASLGTRTVDDHRGGSATEPGAIHVEHWVER